MAELPVSSTASGAGVAASWMSSSATWLRYVPILVAATCCWITTISENGFPTTGWVPSGGPKSQSARGACSGTGTSRPFSTTSRVAVLRAPVRRVPSVGHQRSRPNATVTSSAACQSPIAAVATRSASPP